MSDMGRLAKLAADPQGPVTRGEIFVAVASLYRVQGTFLSARERDLMRDILQRLSRDVEISIRQALAERLADDPAAPHDLVLLLAEDCIEVARPLILRSPVLIDADLHALMKESPDNIELQALLRQRADRPQASAHTSEPAPSQLAPAECAEKLIDKLAASGQLKAGFLLRVLGQGQIDLFELGLARLLQLPPSEMRAKFYDDGPRAVALACRAASIDRCVFPTVFRLSREAHNLRAQLLPGDLAEVTAVFEGFSKPAALSAFRTH
jgi:uncharacterized protein (DUF2336 family)